MEIQKIESEKDRYMDILLLADPSVDFVGEYLRDGNLYVMTVDETAVCASVVTVEGNVAEIKNLSTPPSHQKKGYGSRMMEFIIGEYSTDYEIILCTGGTGIPGVEFFQQRFYRSCGFTEYRIVKNYFVDTYPEPIFEEDGNQCVDMVCMKYVKGGR